MTPLRLAGLIALVFVVSLPATYVMQNGLPTHLAAAMDAEGQETDDPVVDVLCLKALEALSNEQYDKAIASYTEAIGRDPKYSFAYLGRGDAYQAKGDLDRALLDYDHAVRLDPNNFAAKERAAAVRESRAKH
jgi:tetratricopeptide (TPR) repeat protein